MITCYQGYVLKRLPCGRTGVYLHGGPVHLAEDESTARHWIDAEIQMHTHVANRDTRN